MSNAPSPSVHSLGSTAFNPGAPSGVPDFGPDGRLYVVAKRRHGAEVVGFDPVTGEARSRQHLPEPWTSIRIGAQGHALLFGDAAPALWELDGTHTPRPLAEPPPTRVMDAVWDPDGHRVALLSHARAVSLFGLDGQVRSPSALCHLLQQLATLDEQLAAMDQQPLHVGRVVTE